MEPTYFAELDSNNIVIRVIVADQSFVDSIGGIWQETFMESEKKGAGIGDTYDATRDAFISPKPYGSWLLDEETCQWEAPTPMPQDENFYTWNEEQLNWEIRNV
jgi:hypothetical protein